MILSVCYTQQNERKNTSCTFNVKYVLAKVLQAPQVVHDRELVCSINPWAVGGKEAACIILP
jgi:hypothetical protein